MAATHNQGLKQLEHTVNIDRTVCRIDHNLEHTVNIDRTVCRIDHNNPRCSAQ